MGSWQFYFLNHNRNEMYFVSTLHVPFGVQQQQQQQIKNLAKQNIQVYLMFRISSSNSFLSCNSLQRNLSEIPWSGWLPSNPENIPGNLHCQL